MRERNQALLLRAAERVFARRGFGGATVADIATEAGIPKANLHYYYRTKQDLYRAVLDNILSLWLAETDVITPEADPGAAIESYVRAKMRFSREYPDASRVFANEVLHGAREIGAFLSGELRMLVREKCTVLQRWMDDGRIAEINPLHLFFSIWAVTQTYADFSAQIAAVTGASAMTSREYEQATDSAVALFLRGAGLLK